MTVSHIKMRGPGRKAAFWLLCGLLLIGDGSRCLYASSLLPSTWSPDEASPAADEGQSASDPLTDLLGIPESWGNGDPSFLSDASSGQEPSPDASNETPSPGEAFSPGEALPDPVSPDAASQTSAYSGVIPDFQLYEVPILSSESAMNTAVFISYHDRFYLGIPDIAALTRCQASQGEGFITLSRGTEMFLCSEDASADIPCISYNGTLYAEAVPALSCLDATCFVAEGVPALYVIMPLITLGEVLMPDIGSTYYTTEELYGSETARTVFLVCDYLSTQLNVFSGHSITDSTEDYTRDALISILDVDITKYPSVSASSQEQNEKLKDLFLSESAQSIFTQVSETAYDTAKATLGYILDALFGGLAASSPSLSAHASGDYNIRTREILSLTDGFIDTYIPAKATLDTLEDLTPLLSGLYVGLDVSASTYRMANYSQEARELFSNALDASLLSAIGMSHDIYWRTQALKLDKEINSRVEDIAITEMFDKGLRFLQDQGLDLMTDAAADYMSLNGIKLASAISGSVTSLLFRKAHAAFSADLNANFLNEFQQNTIVMLSRLADLMDDKTPSLTHQVWLKALLSLYYREVIAFCENMALSNEEFGTSSDWQTTLSRTANEAARYLYRLSDWVPRQRSAYSLYKDEVLTPEWMEPFLMKVYNNGGDVVEYQGKTYYWRYTAASVDESGLFGYISPNSGVINQLMVREKDGEEHVLLEDGGYGVIYIVNGRLYYTTSSNNWKSIRLDGTDLRIESANMSVEGIDPLSGAMVYQEYDSKVLAVWDKEERAADIVSTADSDFDFRVLAVSDGYVYVSRKSYPDESLSFFRYHIAAKKTESLGGLSLSARQFSIGLIHEGAVFGDDLYVSGVPMQGTGHFYYNGTLDSFSLSGGTSWSLARESDEPTIRYPEFYFIVEDDVPYLYFYGGEETDGISTSIKPWFESGTMRVNLKTHLTESTSEPWIADGSYALINGSLVTRRTPLSQELTTVCDAAALSALGCSDLCTAGENAFCRIGSFSLLSDSAWFTVNKGVREDNSLDMGWRYGYRRTESSVYRSDFETGEVELVYSY